MSARSRALSAVSKIANDRPHRRWAETSQAFTECVERWGYGSPAANGVMLSLVCLAHNHDDIDISLDAYLRAVVRVHDCPISKPRAVQGDKLEDALLSLLEAASR